MQVEGGGSCPSVTRSVAIVRQKGLIRNRRCVVLFVTEQVSGSVVLR